MRYLLLLSALILSSTAAYFSVFGLTKLFSGEFIPILIMAIGLEFSKIISISFLSRMWSSISNIVKIYMTISVIVLILLTSIGIYGFLLSSYQGSKEKMIQNQSIISNLNSKIDKYNTGLSTINENIELLTDKYDVINSNIQNSSRRLDTMYNRKSYFTANKIQSALKEYNEQSSDILSYIELNRINKISIMDSINDIKFEIDKLNIETTNSDIGPIKYISDIANLDIDIVINYFIFIIIFVFDPMAIIMFIAFNKYNIRQISNETDSIIGKSNENGEFEISFINERV